MPRRLEEALKRRAVEKGFKPGTDRYNRYVYGTIAKIEHQRGGTNGAG